MNNSNNIFQQKRILLAVVISFLFFVVYDYFFIPKQPLKIEQNITQQNQQNTSINNTPNIQNTTTNTPSAALVSQDSVISKVQSKHFEAQIDSFGRISAFYLKDKKYQNEKGEFINLVSKENSPYPLEMRFSDPSINSEAFKIPYIANASNLFVDVMDNKETIETYKDGDVEKDESANNVVMTSAFDRYYATFFYNFDKPLNVAISKDANQNPIVFAYSDNEFKAGGYIGSKEHVILRSIDPRLEAVVEYGWFTFIAKPMFEFLNFLHQYIGNWGWAIVVMTLIVRIILFPLTYKSMISMNKLKDLAPKMKDIRERYKGDPQKMNMHMMELYKKHGANPMSGCLPILLQIPIFFAIYRVLLNAIELKAAPWAFWIHDLSVMDPYFILPILMGATMFLQQLITPMTIQDPMQAKIMKFLPVIFTFFFITFPAGLTLYWFVNNLCSLVQQWVINKIFAKEHHKKQAEHEK